MSYADLILWALAVCGVVCLLVLMAWGGSYCWLRYVEFRHKIAEKKVGWATAEADRSTIMSRIAQERMQSDKVITDLRTQLERAKQDLEATKKDTLARRVEEAEAKVRALEIERAKVLNELTSFKITGGDPRWAPDQLIDQLITVMRSRNMVLETPQQMPSVEELAEQIAQRVRDDSVPVIVSELGNFLDTRQGGGGTDTVGLDAFASSLAHIQGRLDEVATALSSGEQLVAPGTPSNPSPEVIAAVEALGGRLSKVQAATEEIASQVSGSIENLVMRSIEVEGRVDKVRTEVCGLVTGGFEAVERAMSKAPAPQAVGGAQHSAAGGVSEVAITQAVKSVVADAVGRLQQSLQTMQQQLQAARTSSEPNQERAPALDAEHLAQVVVAKVEGACRSAIEDSLESMRIAIGQEFTARTAATQASVASSPAPAPSSSAPAAATPAPAAAPAASVAPAAAPAAAPVTAEVAPSPARGSRRAGPPSHRVEAEPAGHPAAPAAPHAQAEATPPPAARRPPSPRVVEPSPVSHPAKTDPPASTMAEGSTEFV